MIHLAMSHDEYRAVEAINFSSLVRMRISPRAYAHARYAPTSTETAAQRVGRALHSAVLERKPPQSELTPREKKAVIAMTTALGCHGLAGRLLAAGSPEVSVDWTDVDTGLKCKGRCDWISERGELVDLKSTSTLDYRAWSLSAERYGYDLQLAWYLRGLRASGIHVTSTWIVAVEKEPPSDVGCFAVSSDVLRRADEECTELLTRVAMCEQRGVWPGRYPDATPLQVPYREREKANSDDKDAGW